MFLFYLLLLASILPVFPSTMMFLALFFRYFLVLRSYAPLYLLDQHSRFPSYNSHAYKYGYLDRPIVDEWFDVLLQLSLRYWPRITTYSPDYCINVTHDVDLPSAYSFRRPRGLLKSLVTNMSSGHDSLITIFQSLLSPPFLVHYLLVIHIILLTFLWM